MLLIIPAAGFIFGASGLAAASAPRGGHVPWGAALSVTSIAVMSLTAWSTYEDGHYDDFGGGLTALAGMVSAGFLLLGLGPLIPWLLRPLNRGAIRLSAPGVALTATATAFAIAVMIIAMAETKQDRTEYFPQARPAALQVELYTEDVTRVRAVLQEELPGTAIVQSDRVWGPRHFDVDLGPEDTELAPEIGDQALLHYLTGDASTPYDENTAVVVTADDIEVTSAEIIHDTPETFTTVPAIVARPADPRINGIFIPTKIVRELGFPLTLDKLIIDPSLHRTTAAEQERIAERLGESASVYVERGFQPPTMWLVAVAAGVLLALGGAFTGFRATRLERRVSGGSAATLQWFVASRVGLGATCGTVLGAAAGYVIGLLLVWPMTISADWEPPPRPPFETPWGLIVALVVGLPLLAAALAAAIPRGAKGNS